MRRRKDAGHSDRAISWASELVEGYTTSADHRAVTPEVDAVVDLIAADEAAQRDLLHALAGLAGQAVMALVAQLDPDPAGEQDPGEREKRLRERRREVLRACAAAFREKRPAVLEFPSATGVAAWTAIRGERRSGVERRLGLDRRRRGAGDPVEMVNLRLFGDRRSHVRDRRSGTDRRRSAVEA